jgi:hypothetical protein
VCTIGGGAAHGMRVHKCIDGFAITLAENYKDLRKAKEQKNITQTL